MNDSYYDNECMEEMRLAEEDMRRRAGMSHFEEFMYDFFPDNEMSRRVWGAMGKAVREVMGAGHECCFTSMKGISREDLAKQGLNDEELNAIDEAFVSAGRPLKGYIAKNERKLLDAIKSGQLTHGWSREAVKAEFGTPDATGGTSRRRKIPLIFKYGETEVVFLSHEREATINYVYVDCWTDDEELLYLLPPEDRMPSP